MERLRIWNNLYYKEPFCSNSNGACAAFKSHSVLAYGRNRNRITLHRELRHMSYYIAMQRRLHYAGSDVVVIFDSSPVPKNRYLFVFKKVIGLSSKTFYQAQNPPKLHGSLTG